MQAKQHANAAHLQFVVEIALFELFGDEQKDQHEQSGKGHAIPDQHGGIEADETSQNASESGNEDR